MRISDWSSDVCSSDLYLAGHEGQGVNAIARATNLSPSTCFGILKTLVGEEFAEFDPGSKHYRLGTAPSRLFHVDTRLSDWSRWLEDQMLALANEFERSEEHTSELQSLMRISYAVFCLKKKQTSKIAPTSWTI